MASHPNTPVRQEHLREATTYAFDELEESVLRVNAALLDQSKHAPKSSDSAYFSRILDRFKSVQHYWLQVRQDYDADQSRDPTNVKSIIDLARKAGYDEGYKHGQTKAQKDQYLEGYGEGFVDGDSSRPNTVPYALFGATLGVAAFFMTRKK
jgi:hypothetical protein